MHIIDITNIIEALSDASLKRFTVMLESETLHHFCVLGNWKRSDYICFLTNVVAFDFCPLEYGFVCLQYQRTNESRHAFNGCGSCKAFTGHSCLHDPQRFHNFKALVNWVQDCLEYLAFKNAEDVQYQCN